MIMLHGVNCLVSQSVSYFLIHVSFNLYSAEGA